MVTPTSFFVGLSAAEQREWAKDLERSVDFATKTISITFFPCSGSYKGNNWQGNLLNIESVLLLW